MSKRPRLRGTARARDSLYPLGEFPDDVVTGLGQLIVHRLAVGHADITGDDFARIFASAISGEHRAKPLGVTDVIWRGCSWSVKTVIATKPFAAKQVRLITGRNSPKYSYGINDVQVDISKTGEAVLNVWNERVNRSLGEANDLRIIVLIRNMERLEFTLFEHEAVRFVPAEYRWELNANENLVAYDRGSNNHSFTWQPHGSQFTVVKNVPASAYRFRIKRHPGIVEPQHVLNLVDFKDDWIEKVDYNGNAQPPE